MTLIKTSFWTGISVFIKIIVTLAISKVVALYTGPVGLAAIEQFQSFIQLVRAFSGSLINQGVIKYVAENQDNEAIKTHIISSATVFCIATSIILSLLLFLFSSPIAHYILQSVSYQKVIIALAASMILYSLNNLFLSILNGACEVKKYVACNLANTLLSLLFTLYFIIYYGLYGGFLALICNQSVVLIFTLSLIVRSKRFKLSHFVQGIDLGSLRKLIKFALIAIIIELAAPVSQMILRNYIAHTLSWEQAGYWQGIMKLSNNYSILFDATMGVYLLPKFSSLQTVSAIKKEIFHSYKLILPLVFVGSLLVFFLKKPIIIILYSRQFLPMMILFKYQIIGDIARVGAWLLSYVLVAKGMIRSLFVTETFLIIIYPMLTIFFVHFFGFAGTSMGFAASYLFYLLVMIFLTYRFFKNYSSQSVELPVNMITC